MPVPIATWDSEDSKPVRSGRNPWAFLYKDTYIIITDAYPRNGSHCTSLMFIGDDAVMLAETWHKFITAREDEEVHKHPLCCNTKPIKALKAFAEENGFKIKPV